jgi:hypothetical protein
VAGALLDRVRADVGGTRRARRRDAQSALEDVKEQLDAASRGEEPSGGEAQGARILEGIVQQARP